MLAKYASSACSGPCTSYPIHNQPSELLALVQPGDCVILNAANSTVGRVIIQLCHLLQLRCVAVVRECEQPLEGFVQLANRLKALGASLVIQDSGSLKVLRSCKASCLGFVF